MAFNINYTGPIGGQSRAGVTSARYVYNNKDGDVVTAAGYFDTFYTQLQVSDIIDVVNYTASVPSAVVSYIVTASASTGVVILAI